MKRRTEDWIGSGTGVFFFFLPSLNVSCVGTAVLAAIDKRLLKEVWVLLFCGFRCAYCKIERGLFFLFSRSIGLW